MPALDKTGPFGIGPVGRGRGGCQQTPDTANAMPENSAPNDMGGRCRNGGRGKGRGAHHGMGQGGCCGSRHGRGSPSLEQETAFLKNSILSLQARLDVLENGKSVE